MDIFLQLGAGLIEERCLGIVEWVPGVDVVADVGQGAEGVVVALQILHGQKGASRLGIGLGLAQLLGDTGHILRQGLLLGTGIGHFMKFHGTDLLFDRHTISPFPARVNGVPGS